MSVRRRFARDAALLTGQAVAQRLVGMLTSVVLARGLGAAGLGTLNALQTTASNAYGFGRLGIDVALNVHLAEADISEQRKGRIVAAAALIMTGAMLVTAALSWLGAGWLASTVFGDPSLAGWLRLAPVLIIAQFGLQFGYSALAGLQRFARYAAVALATAVITLAATLIGVLTLGLPGAVGATLLAAILGAGWLLREVVLGLRASGIRPAAAQAGHAARELLRLGGPFYLTGLLLIPVSYVLQGLLVRTGGLEEMGYLRVMLAIAAIVTFVPASLVGATVSSLAALRTDPTAGDAAFARHAALNVRLVWLYCLLTVLALGAALEPVVRLLFGEAYAAALPAYRWGLLGAMLLAIEGVLGQVLLAGRRVWALFALLTGRAIAFGILGYLMIPGQAVRGYLTADALSLGIFLPLGVVTAMGSTRGAMSTPDGARISLLGALTVAAGCALLPGWDDRTRVLLTLGVLVATAVIGYRLVLDDDERGALRTLPRRLRRRGRP